MSEFDRIASQYRSLVDQAIEGSGSGADYFADRKARYVARLVGNDFSGKVLDFGCGVGLVSSFLRNFLPQVTLHGYDESVASLQHVGSQLRAAGLFTADRQELARDYDLILLANVLHHVAPDQRPGFLNDLKSHLSIGGRLVVFEHNPSNLLTRWVVSRCPFDEGAVLLNRREVIARLQAAGMKVVMTAYVTFFPRPFVWFGPLERWLEWCPLGAQYAVVGQNQP